MKRILTLFICLGTFSSAFAQTSGEEAKRVILGRKKTDGGSNSGKDVVLGGDNRTDRGTSPNYPSYPDGSSRDQQVDQVNREYDAKVQSVRNNPYLSQAEKDRAIRDLNADRARRIRAIDRSFDTDRDNRDRDDNNYKKDKKYKKNNGNRYGWEKGKGNPHKNGGKNKSYKKDRDDD
ncbi:MAG: hypothetical protein JWP69_817 [Flaviaesturariibacter sp.]|nr:hypothetical protein [Flaviaesturariibacter sp.]